MAATVVSSIMPAFQVGEAGKKKERRGDIFPRNSPAAFCLDLIGSELNHMATPNCKGGWEIRTRILKIS